MSPTLHWRCCQPYEGPHGEASGGKYVKKDIDDDAAATSEPHLSRPSGARAPHCLESRDAAHFSDALHHPFRRPSEYGTPTLNPYNTIILTFLATVLRERSAHAGLERAVPWEELAVFLTNIPRRDIAREHHKVSAECDLLLMNGCKLLPEDWCVRGMGWGGKKVFDRGFRNKDADTAGEDRNIQVGVLLHVEIPEQDGIIEDEGDEHETSANDQSPDKRHWVRLARAGLRIARDVCGFKFVAAAPEDGRPC